MNKQEEIRKEIKAYLTEAMDGIEFSDEDEKGLDVMAQNLLEFLVSQGVVIKVVAPFPMINCGRNKRANEAQLDMRDRMLKAGYVATEPLVESHKPEEKEE